jgi:hypothetical protein
MEYLIAVLLFGVLAVYLPRYVAQYLGKFVPTQISSSPFFPVLLVGGSIVLGMFLLKKVGAGKYVREAAGAA